jgi:hypothetical protein
MLPNLLNATHTYWHKLNELEASYQRGEVSLEEVDVRVRELMVELSQERRATIRFLMDGLNRIWREQREMVVGLGVIGILTYAWTSFLAHA